MSRRATAVLLTVGALLLAGCYRGPRRPLFGNNSEAKLGADAKVPPLPPRRLEPNEADALLRRLRRADSEEQREKVVQELVGGGEGAVPRVELALNEERVLVDVLEEILRQLSAEPEDPEGRIPVAPWVEDKYRLALDRSLAGDSYGAIELVEAILALEPQTGLRRKLRRLRRSCEERLLRESVLTADLVASKAILLPEQPLEVELRLENLSTEVLEMRLAEDLRLGTVDIDYELVTEGGTRTRTRTQVPVRARSSVLRLEPGQKTTLAVRLPQPHAHLPAGMAARYHLGGRLRAQTMLVGEGSYRMFVPLFAADVLVLSRRDASLAKYPFRAFEKAVEKASAGPLVARREPARRAFIAALLMVHEDPDTALETIAAALEKARGPLSDALCAALARATREPLNFTRQEWLIWWEGRKSRPTKAFPDDAPEQGSDR